MVNPIRMHEKPAKPHPKNSTHECQRVLGAMLQMGVSRDGILECTCGAMYKISFTRILRAGGKL